VHAFLLSDSRASRARFELRARLLLLFFFFSATGVSLSEHVVGSRAIAVEVRLPLPFGCAVTVPDQTYTSLAMTMTMMMVMVTRLLHTFVYRNGRVALSLVHHLPPCLRTVSTIFALDARLLPVSFASRRRGDGLMWHMEQQRLLWRLHRSTPLLLPSSASFSSSSSLLVRRFSYSGAPGAT
jgi:hypothetical protein